MTRNGKIARLPLYQREQLNKRLQDGEPGVKLVGWLNSQEAVKQVLKNEFNGRPISEQNLSEWKQGGYRDWERHQNSLELVRRLSEQAEDYDETADGVPVSHLLANAMAAELAESFHTLVKEAKEPMDRLKLIRKLLPDLAELRKEDRKAVRALIERDEWERDQELRDRKAAEKQVAEMKRKATEPIWATLQFPMIAQVFGSGEYGWKVAFHLKEIELDLPQGYFAKRLGEPAEVAHRHNENQSESNQIKPVSDTEKTVETSPVQNSPG